MAGRSLRGQGCGRNARHLIPWFGWLIGYPSRQAKREIPNRRNFPKQVNDDSRVQGWYVDTKWIRTIIS